MKTKITLLLLIIALSAFAGKIRPLDYTTLNKKSSIILIGKVENIKQLEGSSVIYYVKVKRISVIKGQAFEKKLTIPIRTNGAKKMYLMMLKKGNKYIFFLNPQQLLGFYNLEHIGQIEKYASDIEKSKKEILIPKISIPLSGNKTTFRFSVKNNSSKGADVYGPFANLTRLVVAYPNGKKQEVFNWKEGIGLTEKLLPGKEIKWNIDITQCMEFKEEGEYKISFTVNGIKSNQIIVVKDKKN